MTGVQTCALPISVYDLLHVNPGAAGEYGFHKVRTAVRLVIDGADMRDMEVGEWPRR